MFQLMVLFLAFAGLLSQAAALPFVNSTGIHNCSEASPTHSIHARAELKVSDKGLCGGKTGQTCKDSLFGDACGQWGYCGSYYNAAYAGVGCQPKFGVCNPDLNDPAPTGNTTTVSSQTPSLVSSSIPISANSSSSSTLTTEVKPTGVVITPISVVTVPLTTTVIKTVTVKEAQATGS
ncbi:hypothetical protein CBER1_04435 [Cercospora berteroae]|uniref:Chitin-binding type-1 domain-containing protein n=1 Tax=Cercospora berteroae TaxID=357750 RepID=A0A2S6CGM1_9PEZI|nr:hypothetical protein CBER1_04435 [Cercospora berteroae]